MRHALSAALFAIHATVAGAETVRLQTGNHDGFTRVVFDFSERPVWSLGSDDDGFTLRFDRPGLSFDTRGAYDMISRQRVAEIFPEPGGRDVRLRLACDCSVSVEELGTRYLIVDVKDAPPDDTVAALSRPEDQTPKLPNTPELPQRTIDLRSDVASAYRPPMIPPSEPRFTSPGLLMDPLTFELALSFAQPLAETEDPNIRAPFQTVPEQTRTLDLSPPAESDVPDLTNRLAEQIGRAASQGLIDGEAPATQSADPIDPAIAAEVTAENIRIRSAIDEALGDLREGVPIDDLGTRCLPSHLVSIGQWLPPEDLDGTISDLRSKLVTELGDTDPDIVGRLVRRYISLSFGIEAKALLAQFEGEIPHAEVLESIATLVEGDSLEDPGPLAGQTECDNAAALWSLLADPDTRLPVNSDAIVLEFSGFPIFLRRHLGLSLAEAFLDRGDDGAARLVRAAITRAPGDHGTRLRMLNASIAEEDGDTRSDQLLSKVATSDKPESPEAMIRYLASAHEDGRMVALTMIELTETMSFERRGLPVAVDLKRAELQARIDLLDFDAAATALFRTAGQGDLPPADQRALWESFLGRLAKDGSDGDLLRIGFQPKIWSEALASGSETRQALVDRLLGVGFWRETEALLDGAETNADWVVLARAEAALKGGRPRDALIALVTSTGEKADALRAEALSRSRAFIEASQVYETTGNDDAGAALAWRAGDFPRAAELGDGARPDVARLIAPPTIELPDLGADAGSDASSPQLTEGRSLIEESAGVRSEISEILTKFPRPPMR